MKTKIFLIQVISIFGLFISTAHGEQKLLVAQTSNQSGRAGDILVIERAMQQLIPQYGTSLSVKQAPGLVICDLELDGDDCQARKVQLTTGESKFLMILKRDQNQFLKSGDAVLINLNQLAYVDRSRELECKNRKGIGLSLTDATGFGFRVNVPLDFRLKGWTLRSAANNNIMPYFVVQKSNSTFKALTGYTFGNPDGEGLICASETILELNPALPPTMKRLNIPSIKGE